MSLTLTQSLTRVLHHVHCANNFLKNAQWNETLCRDDEFGEHVNRMRVRLDQSIGCASGLIDESQRLTKAAGGTVAKTTAKFEEQLKAIWKIADETPRVSFGYVGNLTSTYDDRCWKLWVDGEAIWQCEARDFDIVELMACSRMLRTFRLGMGIKP